MLRKALFVVVLIGMALSLAACGGNNVVDNAKNAAQELFVKEGPGGMTRPEAAALWATEIGKLQMCENVARKGEVVYIKVVKANESFQFVLFSNDKPECGMTRPWSPVLKSLLASGAYSAKNPDAVASK
ncbi:hypothetical protein ANAEL_03698 [Anaerolineales bacterium]|nr:hypothetical protein ANAEL_03698 [Anaerolineales bacterium]